MPVAEIKNNLKAGSFEEDDLDVPAFLRKRPETQ